MGLSFVLAGTVATGAHPHVFVEASMEVVIDNDGKFSELRHVWRFDELFSATIVIDYDQNTDGKLDETEMNAVTKIVKESIAEYDFYTALRSGTEVINFYEPDKLSAYIENGQMIMFFAIEPENPHDFKKAPLRISASDTSYYVAFEFDQTNVKLIGGGNSCKTNVTIPDYDSLYANNDQTLTEAFFNDPSKPQLGDEFYSWAQVSC